ncbi:RTA-like protein [Metarhizium rileyi]|uniref:RTA-like protein n=1 Tax=Metarhizium rileyi (strain RCEF 4871) TaxID=1649241 RepID=A0A166WKY2_METRR|nr:RTA-like protein [Metarhizium rileyi RCEF 4871]
MEADCGSSCPVPGGFYSYRPNVGGNAVLLAVYALLLPAVLYLGIRLRTLPFSLILASGHLVALIGYVGRILLHRSPDNAAYFLLSLLGSVLGPSLITASICVACPHILSVYGEGISSCSPKLVGSTLCISITTAVVVEVVGSVLVTYGFGGNSRTNSASIIVAGLSVQAAALFGSAVVYFFLVLTLSSGHRAPDEIHSRVYMAPKFGRFLRAIELSTTILLAYSIYRIVELAGGVDSGLFQNEIAFMIMDGALPLVSAILLTAFHPGAAFGAAWKQTSPRQLKRANDFPAEQEAHRLSYNTHHAYDPNIRKQTSPSSYHAQPMAASACSPETQSGPSGLPSNPRPNQKAASPRMPSPRSTASTSKRLSDRINLRKDMVDSDALW